MNEARAQILDTAKQTAIALINCSDKPKRPAFLDLPDQRKRVMKEELEYQAKFTYAPFRLPPPTPRMSKVLAQIRASPIQHDPVNFPKLWLKLTEQVLGKIEKVEIEKGVSLESR